MQQELVRKKREIIEIFLKNGVLISSELLNEIENDEQADKIFSLLKTKKTEDLVVTEEDLNKLFSKQKTGQAAEQKQEKSLIANVKIITSYKDDSKKREASDFVDYFNIRYRAIEKILKQHQELKNTVSISKILNKKDKEAISIIGIVSSKQVTKNGNLLLMLEDPTGQRRVLVNKNKPTLFNEAKDIVLDEVIGIVGVNVDTLMFANNVIWPEVPTSKELTKAPEEKYAIFLSDLHVGSSKFLPEDFEKFLKWINCEMGNEQQRHIAKNVEYIFIAGDLVDGVGIYPGQDTELLIKDIYEQYKACAEYLKQIPSHIPLIICPGNHDAVRDAEPQPPLPSEFVQELEQAHGGHRGRTRSLQHERIARGDAHGHHPAHRNHPGKIEGHDAGENADGFAEKDRVESGRSVHQGFAHHQDRRAAGDFDRFPYLEDIALGLFPYLPVFVRADQGQLVQMGVDQVPELVQHLDPLDDRGGRPGRIGGACGFYLRGALGLPLV